MREELNENTFFNTLAMARQNVSTLILVVEGDDDYFLLKPHHNPTDLLLIPGKGKPTTLATATLAEKRGLSGVRFLVDSDYDQFVSPGCSYPANVFVSTNHDVMMDTLLSSPRALERVISAHTRGAMRNGANINPETAQKCAFLLAACVAPLRIVNDRKSMGLRLDAFPFGEVPSLQPTDIEIATLVAKRSSPDISAAVIASEMADEGSHRATPQESIVGDHDFFRALARVLSEHGARVKPETLFTTFLATIGCVDIALTAWYLSIMSWGKQNLRSPFTCSIPETRTAL